MRTLRESADILDGAADALIVFGRARRRMRDNWQRLCLLGAICYARGESLDDPEAYVGLTWSLDDPEVLAFRRFLRDNDLVGDQNIVGNQDGPCLWLWNDFTDDDRLIIGALRACAAELRIEADREARLLTIYARQPEPVCA